VPTPSWRLKIARAEHLRDEVEGLIDSYAAGQHYRAVCPRSPRMDRTRWHFVLEVTQPPDEEIAVIVGEYLYDLRSALDHIAVSVAPKRRKSLASFPIFTAPPTKPDEIRAWEKATKGMPAKAVEIEQQQPYNLATRAPSAKPYSVDSLYSLSALQNADKHRSLAVVALGISDPTVQLSWGTDGVRIMIPTYVGAGKQLVSSERIGNRVPYDDLQVDVQGRPHVTVTLPGHDEFQLTTLLDGCLQRVRDRVVPALEPFARV
jgi:hypothetical protein